MHTSKLERPVNAVIADRSPELMSRGINETPLNKTRRDEPAP